MEWLWVIVVAVLAFLARQEGVRAGEKKVEKQMAERMADHIEDEANETYERSMDGDRDDRVRDALAAELRRRADKLKHR